MPEWGNMDFVISLPLNSQRCHALRSCLFDSVHFPHYDCEEGEMLIRELAKFEKPYKLRTRILVIDVHASQREFYNVQRFLSIANMLFDFGKVRITARPCALPSRISTKAKSIKLFLEDNDYIQRMLGSCKSYLSNFR